MVYFTTCSLTSLLNDACAELIILLLRNPHLVEASQASQDTTTNPASILPLDTVTRSLYLHSRGVEHGRHLVVQSIIEAINKC